jgi:arylsulfatase A-like enzyme
MKGGDVPDVFWIVTDEHRADALRCDGNPRVHSPHLDQLAAEGVYFTRAYCQAPACVASRASFLAGRYPHQTGNLWFDRTRDDVPFFVDVLTRSGVGTINIGKEHHNRLLTPFHRSLFTHPITCFADPSVGFRVEGGPRGLNPAFAQREAELGILRRHTTAKKLILAGRSPVPADRMEPAVLVDFAMQVARDFLGGGVAQANRSVPLLLRLSMLAPHTPVLVPPPFDTMYHPADMDFPEDGMAEMDPPPYLRDALITEGVVGFTRDEIRLMRAHYYGLCSYVDQQLGRFLEFLRRTWPRPYVVIFHADHGNLLGEHGLHEKFNLYQPSVRVPLIMAGADIPAAVVRDQLVELVDLAPTMMSLLGIRPEGLDLVGRDLLPLVRDAGVPWRRIAFCEFARDGRSLKYASDGRHVLSVRATWEPGQGQDPEGSLFDLQQDPGEKINLFHRPEHAAVRERMLGAIRDWQGTPC